ncbi:hypothetical protein C2G38_2190248 [Gigaspora rosea]|uniref:Uncharacterized protein n=1 Tax=Gigaspora rosea TaxID=44941 RepID=A0A397V350_9GLOM|nr:hypothetical protein C2G38_2190248 [Gigaspora rosea]
MQTQRDESKNLSELDLLKQRVIDFETENIKLKGRGAGFSDSNDSKIIKIGQKLTDNAKLKQTLKEHEIRIINLEQRDKEKTVTNMRNDLSTKDASYEINSNNTPEKIIDTSDNALNSDNTQSKIVILEEFNINLVNDNLWLRNEIEKLKKDIDELKKELESKKNCKFQEKCILIAQVLIGEEPVVEYCPFWYKNVKKLEDVVDRDRKKRCLCQLNGIYLIEIWYDENPEVTIPKKISKYRECINRKIFELS